MSRTVVTPYRRNSCSRAPSAWLSVPGSTGWTPKPRSGTAPTPCRCPLTMPGMSVLPARSTVMAPPGRCRRCRRRARPCRPRSARPRGRGPVRACRRTAARSSATVAAPGGAGRRTAAPEPELPPSTPPAGSTGTEASARPLGGPVHHRRYVLISSLVLSGHGSASRPRERAACAAPERDRHPVVRSLRFRATHGLMRCACATACAWRPTSTCPPAAAGGRCCSPDCRTTRPAMSASCPTSRAGSPSADAVVVQDVRGKVRSGGELAPFRCEVVDGYDTIDWITEQTWSRRSRRHVR